MNQKVLRSVALVVIFWWLVLAVWGLFTDQDEWTLNWQTNGLLMGQLVWALIGGSTLVWLDIWSKKWLLRKQLVDDNVRGLSCTIGAVPLIAHEPKQHTELPPFGQVTEVLPGWYEQWLTKFQKTHPGHAELMASLLRIYHAFADLPATHIKGGHGSRSLLDHSLLTGFYMDKLSRTWRYNGLRDRTGKRVVLKLRDADYVFNADDPLVAILGVAHDIGKIEAYIFDSDRKIIGIHHEHDLTGARMVARLPSAWLIPDEDRRALFLAIAHYHHPMELPLSPDRRAIDDRTIALMELLIKTDFVVSRVESGEPEPDEADYEVSNTSPQVTATPDRLVGAFLEIIGEHSRINSADKRFSVGTLCDGKGFSKPMLLINEASIRSAIIQRLQLPNQMPLGDRRYQLTIDLLTALDAKGCLYRKHDGVEYSAENAIWNVDFFARPEKDEPPEKKAGWAAVIIVDPKIHPKVEQTDPYWWYAIVARGTMGAARAVNKAGSVLKNHRAANSLAGDDAEIEAALASARGAFSALQDDEPDEESPQRTATQLASEEMEDSEGVHHQTVDNPTEPVTVAPAPAARAKRSKEPVLAKVEPHQLTPIVVLAALRNVVAASKAGDLPTPLTEHSGMYVVSTRLLVAVLPQIEWIRFKYQLQTFCASGTLEAQLLDETDGHYVIAIAVAKIDG